MGADLSYVNEIEDAGGEYYANDQSKDAFGIFKENGCNNVRVRLWHTPTWKKEVTNGRLYSDLTDVEKTIRRAKQAGMSVNLNLHYSDDWADPNKQNIPAAWAGLPFKVLQDSVYNYTLSVLNYLQARELVPVDVITDTEHANTRCAGLSPLYLHACPFAVTCARSWRCAARISQAAGYSMADTRNTGVNPV